MKNIFKVCITCLNYQICPLFKNQTKNKKVTQVFVKGVIWLSILLLELILGLLIIVHIECSASRAYN